MPAVAARPRDVGAEVGSQRGEHGGAAAQRILHRLLVAPGLRRWAEPGISSARGACSKGSKADDMHVAPLCIAFSRCKERF